MSKQGHLRASGDHEAYRMSYQPLLGGPVGNGSNGGRRFRSPYHLGFSYGVAVFVSILLWAAVIGAIWALTT
jgi:hypothetical protein